MTSRFLNAGDDGGHRVVLRIADACRQARIMVRGTVRTTGTILVGSSPSYRFGLCDGTGEIDVIFLGRATVGGIDPGRRVRVEGTVGSHHGRYTIWNPAYELEPAPAPQARRESAPAPGGACSPAGDRAFRADEACWLQ